MQNLHEKNAFFMDKKLVVNGSIKCLHESVYVILSMHALANLARVSTHLARVSMHAGR